jgi:isopenicillin-N N-acyltransferase like protein
MDTSRRIRRLRLEGTPSERGRAHGRAYAASIREYTHDRVNLAADGSWAGRPATRGDILALAQEMLPVHRAYAPDLTLELEAMADAAGISAAEAVILGGFTDFVDAVRARAGAGAAPFDEDDCTAVLTSDYLAQTWDMHASATPHVVLLDVRDTSPCLVFSTVGCLAQIGMNAAGIAIGINNLVSTDGRVGVTWPFVVRKVLQQTTLDAALRCIVEAPLAGAHNYLLLDARGNGYNLEAMPTHTAITRLESTPLVHTNHCLDAETSRREAERAPALLSSSRERLARAISLSAGPLDLEQMFAMTRDPVICRRSEPPYHVESSGAVVMRPSTRDLWAVWGVPVDHSYEQFRVDDASREPA